jgi:hypothetical protein
VNLRCGWHISRGQVDHVQYSLDFQVRGPQMEPHDSCDFVSNIHYNESRIENPFLFEECRLPGYKNTVRTSQETHYVSATESSRLMLCKI